MPDSGELEPIDQRLHAEYLSYLNSSRICAITMWCDQIAVDLWDSNPLLTKEKQLTKLMVLLSDLAPNLVRTSLHQSV